MCGIAGIVSLDNAPLHAPERSLAAMSALIAHRGPDGDGVWFNRRRSAGLAHRRLAIVDLGPAAAQPMVRPECGLALVHNGEIYNHTELRDQLGGEWTFASRSDSETILAAYARWGERCVEHLRGMFAFALWDQRRSRLFCARDRFGIKPLYYAAAGGALLLSSEVKALLPLLPAIETDPQALAEYLTFQYAIGAQTLFRGVFELPPAHALVVADGRIQLSRYWQLGAATDPALTDREACAELRDRAADSLRLHLRSDVPVGQTLSGGVNSTLVTVLAADHDAASRPSFHGTFEISGAGSADYDESRFARIAAAAAGSPLSELAITAADFRNEIENVAYHLDFPVAGPGAFAQFMVSRLAASRVKVVLGGQGGDEVFGGYARYLVAHLEQSLLAAIDDADHDATGALALGAIAPGLGLLREYKPLLAAFWRDGLFAPIDARYFRLIDRTADLDGSIDWTDLDRAGVYERYRSRFNAGGACPLDRMTRFDLAHSLPALLQVEDRTSMAHGLESRLPLLDHPLVELALRVPAQVRFGGGQLKRLLKLAFTDRLPPAVRDRRDKMGFPVPLREWFQGDLRDFVGDLLGSRRARERPYLRADRPIGSAETRGQFSRGLWALLSLELWQRTFHDRAAEWRRLADDLPHAASAT